MNTLSAKSYAFKFGIYNLSPLTVVDFFILVLTYGSDHKFCILWYSITDHKYGIVWYGNDRFKQSA